MVLIYLEFSSFPSMGIAPENLGMAQNLCFGEFGRGREGSHVSDRFGFSGCFNRKVQIQDLTICSLEMKKFTLGNYWIILHMNNDELSFDSFMNVCIGNIWMCTARIFICLTIFRRDFHLIQHLSNISLISWQLFPQVRHSIVIHV